MPQSLAKVLFGQSFGQNISLIKRIIMNHVSLNAEVRVVPTPEKNLLRQKGLVPAELYGSQTENSHLLINEIELGKVYKQAGESTVVDINVAGGKTVPVIFHDVQTDPVSDRIIHVDFYQVDMKKKLETAVPLTFVGEPAIIKQCLAVLIHQIDEIEIKCLPDDLPNHIEVDLNLLINVHDSIAVKDLKIPSTIEVLTDPETTIVLAGTPQKADVEVKAEVVVPTAEEAAATAEAAAKAESGGK